MIHTRYNNGMSLLSLLIGSIIGLFVIGAAVKIYVDSKSTFLARDALSAVTENARFSLEDIRRSVAMAGREILHIDDNKDAYSTTDNGKRTFPAMQAGGIVSSDANGNSVIAVRYAYGPSCGGHIGDQSTKTPATEPATVRFLVDAEEEELECEVNKGNKWSRQPLVSGIKRMFTLYGVDDDQDGYANRYLSGEYVDNESRWANVVSVRVGLVAGSGKNHKLPGGTRPKEPQTLDLMRMVYTAPTNDQLYRVASTTISLRNLNSVIQRQ